MFISWNSLLFFGILFCFDFIVCCVWRVRSLVYLSSIYGAVLCCAAAALGCKSASQSAEMGKIRVGRGDERWPKIYVCKGNVTLGACQCGGSGSSITCSHDVLPLHSTVFSWQHDIPNTSQTKHGGSCWLGTEALNSQKPPSKVTGGWKTKPASTSWLRLCLSVFTYTLPEDDNEIWLFF